MKRRNFLALLSTSLGLAACGGDKFVWRQKLVVAVNTPSGKKTGSAVTEVTASVGYGGLNGHMVSYRVRGEATVVEVGKGKYLFAVLSSGGQQMATEYWAENTFASDLPRQNDPKPTWTTGSDYLRVKYAKMTALRGSRTMSGKTVPLIVTFTDLTEPKSVVAVSNSNIESLFGAGHSLASVSLELTDEPVTEGAVKALLPWAETLAGSIGKHTSHPPTHILNQLNDGSFVRNI